MPAGRPCRVLQTGQDMGFAVKLDTNGSRPAVIKRLLDQNLVDFIAMDIKAPLSRLAELTGTISHGPQIRQSIALIAASGVDHLFRTTDVKPLLSSEDHRGIKKLVPPGSLHIVQPFVAKNAMAPSLRIQ